MGKGNSGSRASANNRSNQMNPNNPAYHSSRGDSGKASRDNRSNQMNPNNKSYFSSRGLSSGGCYSPTGSGKMLKKTGKILKTGKGKASLAAGAALGIAAILGSRKKHY